MDDKNKLVEYTEDVVTKLVNSQDADEIKQLTQLFNINQMKKNALRIVKLNGILDKLDNQVEERVTNNPESFSNNDLLNYVNTIQQTVTKSSQSLDGIQQIPTIQINQNNNIVNVETALPRESRQKILDVVQQILNNNDSSFELDADDVIYYSEEDKDDTGEV